MIRDNKNSIWAITFWLVPAIAFLLVYSAIPTPSIGMTLLKSTWSWLCLAPLLLLTLRIENPIGNALTLLLISVSIYLVLLALWTTGYSDGGTYLGGFVPMSDANGYFTSAQQLNLGFKLSAWGTRRPLAHCFLAVLYALSGKNLPVTLALCVGICSIAIFLSTIEVRKQLGANAAVAYTLIVLVFYKRFIGTTLSENLGTTIAVLSVAALIRGCYSRSLFWLSGGTFLLSLALNARAGAFFTLPFIILWALLIFAKGKTREEKITVTAAVTGAALLGFVVNFALIKLIGSPEGAGFGNFSYTLYGLVYGGDWTLYMQNPALRNLPENEIGPKIYSMVLVSVSHDPTLLLKGMYRAWAMFFSGSIFGFVYDVNLGFLCCFLTALGLVFAVWDRKRFPLLLVFSFCGIVLSVPFAPPWDSDSMRAYAATIPLIALIPAFAVHKIAAGLASWIDRRNPAYVARVTRYFSRNAGDQPSDHVPLAVLAIVVVSFCFPAPVILQRVSSLAHKGLADAKWITDEHDGKVTARLLLNAHDYLSIVPNTQKRTFVPKVRQQDFFAHAQNVGAMYPELLAVLQSELGEGKSLAYDPRLNSWVIVPTRALAKKDCTLTGRRRSVKFFPFIIFDAT